MNKVGKIKDWNKLVRKLYNTGEYFVKRPLISKDQTDYWIDGKSDPDGKTRNIILEKDRYRTLPASKSSVSICRIEPVTLQFFITSQKPAGPPRLTLLSP